jgi:hypothetical protein
MDDNVEDMIDQLRAIKDEVKQAVEHGYNVEGMAIISNRTRLAHDDLRELEKRTENLEWFCHPVVRTLVGVGEHVTIKWRRMTLTVNVCIEDDDGEIIFDHTASTTEKYDTVLRNAAPPADHDAYPHYLREVGRLVDVKECDRCGGAHSGLRAYPLSNHEGNSWTMCPKTDQPTLGLIVDSETFKAEALAGAKKHLDRVWEMLLDGASRDDVIEYIADESELNKTK